MLDPGVEFIFSLMGTFLGGGFIGLILPGLFYLRLIKLSTKIGLSKDIDKSLVCWSYISIFLGLGVALTSLVTHAFGFLWN